MVARDAFVSVRPTKRPEYQPPLGSNTTSSKMLHHHNAIISLLRLGIQSLLVVFFVVLFMLVASCVVNGSEWRREQLHAEYIRESSIDVDELRYQLCDNVMQLLNRSKTSERDLAALIDTYANAAYNRADTMGVASISSATFYRQLAWNTDNALALIIGTFTLVGWGQLWPATLAGRILLMLFTSIGAISTLIIVSAMANAHRAWILLFADLITRFEPGTGDVNLRMIRQLVVRDTFAFVVALLVGCATVGIGAIVMMRVENEWSWLDAIYFIIMTMTTIGASQVLPADLKNNQMTIWTSICLGAFVCTLLAVICCIFRMAIELVTSVTSCGDALLDCQEYYKFVEERESARKRKYLLDAPIYVN